MSNRGEIAFESMRLAFDRLTEVLPRYGPRSAIPSQKWKFFWDAR